MLLLDLLKYYNSMKKFFVEKYEAMASFVRQKKAIDWIRDTKWYEAIKSYFVDIAQACNDRLRTMKTEKDMMRVQGELDISMGFLDFLDNLRLETLSKEDLNILSNK